MSIAFGYAAGAPAMPPRLPLEAITFTGRTARADQAVLDEWYEQTGGVPGQQLGHALRPADRLYNRRLLEAEAGLRRRILGEDGGPSPVP